MLIYFCMFLLLIFTIETALWFLLKNSSWYWVLYFDFCSLRTWVVNVTNEMAKQGTWWHLLVLISNRILFISSLIQSYSIMCQDTISDRAAAFWSINSLCNLIYGSKSNFGWNSYRNPIIMAHILLRLVQNYWHV